MAKKKKHMEGSESATHEKKQKELKKPKKGKK